MSENIEEIELMPCDIFLTRGKGCLSKAIRFFTRSIGEKRTKVNHVGIFVSEGNIKTAATVEALIKVKKHTLWSQYGPKKKDQVAVFRPLNLNGEEKRIITDQALKQVGKKYGWPALIAHFLDWICFGAYLFRRLVIGDKYPICSWLVADAYSMADKHFNVDPGQAQPDDIWDFVTENKDKYTKVFDLTRIW